MFVHYMYARLRAQAQLPNDAVCDRVGIAKFMGPKPDDAPAGSAECPRAEPVSCDVAFQFWKPIIFVACRLATVFGASVPEAAVHKYHEAFAAKGEIRAARQWLVATPAGDSSGPEYGGEFEFRFSVSPRTNSGHHLGALFSGEYVRHQSSPFLPSHCIKSTAFLFSNPAFFQKTALLRRSWVR